MRKRKTMIAAVLGIVLLGTVHAAYGYWTDQIQVREEVALVWPVEVEIEEESEEIGSEESESAEGVLVETKGEAAESNGIESAKTERAESTEAKRKELGSAATENAGETVRTENPERSGDNLPQELEA